MKRVFISLLIVFCSLVSLYAFDVVIPSKESVEYELYSDGEKVVIDNNIFSKQVLPGIKVSRFEDNITLIYLDGYARAVVLLNASEKELEDSFFALYYDTEDPVVIAINSPLDVSKLIELEASVLYTTETLATYDRTLLKRGGIDVKSIAQGDVISIGEDSEGGTESYLESIYSNEGKGFYISCPSCGTMIYLPAPY